MAALPLVEASRAALDDRVPPSFAVSGRQCPVSGHTHSVSQDIRIDHLILLGHVEGPPGGHCRCRRRPLAERGRRRLRRVPALDLPARGPLPGRGRGRLLATLPATSLVTIRDPAGGGRTRRAAAQATRRAGPRRRPTHHLLAPDRAPRPHRVHGDGVADPDPPRAGHPRTEETPEVVLHPVRGRIPQPDVANRLHPLPPRRRAGCRDPQLPRRPLPLPAGLRRLPAGHRPGCRRHLPRRRHPPRPTSQHALRQRHGLHHPLRRRPRPTPAAGPTRADDQAIAFARLVSCCNSPPSPASCNPPSRARAASRSISCSSTTSSPRPASPRSSVGWRSWSKAASGSTTCSDSASVIGSTLHDRSYTAVLTVPYEIAQTQDTWTLPSTRR